MEGLIHGGACFRNFTVFSFSFEKSMYSQATIWQAGLGVFGKLCVRPEKSSHTPEITLLKDYNPEKHFAPFSRLNLTLHIADTFFFFCIYITNSC